MAYLSGKDCAYVLVDGVDVAVSNNELELTSEAVVQRRRPLGQAWRSVCLTGQIDSEMAIRGWLHPDTVAELAEFSAGAKVVSALIGGNAISQLFAGIPAAYVVGGKLGVSEDDLDSYEPVLLTSDAKWHTGYVVAPLAERTTAGNTDSDDAQRDSGAAASGRAFLHVTDLDLGGYTSLGVTLRHSSDGITYADHTSLGSVTAVGGSVITLTGTINQYLSIAWTWTGTGSNPSWTGFVGVAVD